MIAVIFEFEPEDGRMETYLDHARALAPLVQNATGFRGVERFESLTRPGHFVSLSFWDSEEDVAAWRRDQEHRAAQQSGRDGVFAGYRLRVAQVIRDYSGLDRGDAPDGN